MSALTSLLARDQVVPVRKIEEALQKQVVSGGEIATVLLELEALPENTLAAYEAALAELLPATREEVMRVARDTVRLVPREVAEKHRLVPLAVDGRALIIAVANPLTPEVEGQLGFLLGYELVSRIVLEVRIAAALQHHYGVEPSARFRRLIDKLRQRDAGQVPYVAPPQTAKVERARLSALPKKKSSASWLDDDDEEPPLALPPRRSSFPPPSDGRTTDPHGFARPSAVPPEATAPATVPPLDGSATEIVATPYLGERSTDHGTPPPPVHEAPVSRAPSLSGSPSSAGSPTPSSAGSPTPSSPGVHGAQSSSGAVAARVVGVGVRRSSRPPAPSELPSAQVLIPRAAPLPGASGLPGASREPVLPARPPQPAPARPVARPPSASGFRSARDPDPPPLTPTQRAIRKVRGPLTAAVAARLLDDATARDDVLEVFFVFARQFFDYSALFAVSADLAEGRDAFGPGATVESVRRIAVPLDVPGSFAVARKSRGPRVSRMDVAELDAIVLRDLERPRDVHALILPIVLRDRVVVLFYGDRGSDPLELSDVPELLAFVPRVASAIERVILRKKKSGGFSRVDEQPAEASREELKAAAKLVASLPPPRPARTALKSSERWSAPPANERTSAPPAIANEAVAPRSLADVIRSTVLSDASVELSAGSPLLPSAATLAVAAPAEGAARAPAKRPGSIRQMAGIPRTAPPPPTSDAFDLGMLPIPGMADVPAVPEPVVTGSFGAPTREGRDTFPQGLLPASGRATEPAPPPDGADDADPEVVIGSADDSDFDTDDMDDAAEVSAAAPTSSRPGSVPAPKRETYLYKDAAVDVVGPARASRPGAAYAGRATPSATPLRPSTTERTTQPERVAPRESLGPTRRVDPRREGDDAPAPERVRVPSQDRGERVTGNIRPTLRGSVPPPGAPSVIVDMGSGVGDLVQNLVHAGPDDEHAIVEALMRLGDAPLPVLAQAFPGPLWFDRKKPHRKVARGRDVSAIARALYAYGDRAIPYVASLLGSADAERRYYAASLATELLHGGLVDALVQRVFDDDAPVRKLAIESLGRHRGLPEMQEVLVFLRRTARIRGKDPQKRLRAIGALGGMRDGGALRLLIELLEDDDGGVVHAAHLALVEITCEDLGASARKWSAWADRNEGRHRIEWLIDALTHGDEALRAAAGDDLKHLTQQYFGFHAPSSKKDREVVQQKYRTWWETAGRRIHTGH